MFKKKPAPKPVATTPGVVGIHRPMKLYKRNEHSCATHPPCTGCSMGMACEVHDTPSGVVVCLDCYGGTPKPGCPYPKVKASWER